MNIKAVAPDWKNAIGEKLKGLRLKEGETQTEFATRAGVCLRMIVAIELGKLPGNLTTNTLRKICDATGTDQGEWLSLLGVELTPALNRKLSMTSTISDSTEISGVIKSVAESGLSSLTLRELLTLIKMRCTNKGKNLSAIFVKEYVEYLRNSQQ